MVCGSNLGNHHPNAILTRVMPAGRLSIPSRMTSTAAPRMKCLCTAPFVKLDAAPTAKSIGSVPREKSIMVRPPVRALPCAST